MSKTVEIQVNGKTFKLGYGLEVFLSLGELWGLDTLEEVNERFQVLLQFQEGKTLLSNMKTMSEIVEAMIAGNIDNKEFLTAREIRCLDMGQFEQVMTQLIKGFAQNMPQASTEEKEEDSEKKTKPRGKK
ncbi:hypothetical protein [Flavobacterium aquiphilum]|uniref:hypothetical protein n=1 Tax=Flavobacterium aquiphilum TaxID=3003261 RepID=UPI0024813520|nr:hypothetical protein [Flavobacterium aquiphilum]